VDLGIYTFAENSPDPATGVSIPQSNDCNLMEEVELADGRTRCLRDREHIGPTLSSHAGGGPRRRSVRSKRIRLTSAVTVLSSDDPVRVFQEFATVDLLSGGRAEIMAGRGSFIESYPLFGYNLDDYDELFAEKLDLLLALRKSTHVTWRGKHRASIDNRGVYPRPVQDPIPVWIAVGGTPQSVVRAGTLGLPLAVAIIGGTPAHFTDLVNLYREAGRRAGHAPESLKLSINSHGFVADTSQQASDDAWPPYLDTMGRIGRERGWPPPTRQRYEAERSPRGALLIGDPQEVIDKILYEHELFRMNRFLMQFSVGSMPHAKMLRAIELFGTKVAPAVRQALSPAAASD
jgi:probable LLM family oxidoreductase